MSGQKVKSERVYKPHMELRFRPKSDFLHQAGWQELYVLTEYWNSDMNYYIDEFRFLRNLIGRYFIWLVNNENIGQARAIYNKIVEAEQQKDQIHDKIRRHMQRLSDLAKDPDAHGEEEFRNEHARLEEEVAELAKKFRSIKKEVFDISEHIIESEKLQHLLNP